ncbi:MAG TPA: SMP-30/gluconolactonase/LRE family protein [Terriglobales bacterium]
MRKLIPLFAIALAVAAQEAPFQATDFTKEQEFAIGIEGPAVDRKGTLYVLNLHKDGNVARVHSDGTTELFVELPAGSTPNGTRFHSDGSMLLADYSGHNILRVNMKTREVSVWAHEARMNQPNDIAITHNNTLFASDPNWKDNTGNLWRIAPDRKVTLIESNMGTTNGIEVTPDDRDLYVNESIQRRVWRYELHKDGSVTGKKLFAQFFDHGLDGMRCDRKGNLYIARYGKGTVVVLSPQGNPIREIQLKGKNPTNLTFSRDYKTVYVTIQDRGMIEQFRVP